MSTLYVHTLGDSTLDNFYWMLNGKGDNATQAKQDSVEGQLQQKLNGQSSVQYRVVSHAYDGFTTKSVLEEDNVGRVLPKKPGIETYYVDRGVLNPSSHFVYPLNQFKESVEKNPKATHYVVISVGGNDFRERLRGGSLRELVLVES